MGLTKGEEYRDRKRPAPETSKKAQSTTKAIGAKTLHLLRACWTTSRVLSLMILLLAISLGILPIASAQAIANAVNNIALRPISAEYLIAPLAILGILVFVQYSLNAVFEGLTRPLARRIDATTYRDQLVAALNPRIERRIRSQQISNLQMDLDDGLRAGDAIDPLAFILSRTITVVIATCLACQVTILAVPSAFIAIILAWVTGMIIGKRDSVKEKSPIAKQRTDLGKSLTDIDYAKDLQVYRPDTWLLHRRRSATDDLENSVRISTKWLTYGAVLGLTLLLCLIGSAILEVLIGLADERITFSFGLMAIQMLVLIPGTALGSGVWDLMAIRAAYRNLPTDDLRTSQKPRSIEDKPTSKPFTINAPSRPMLSNDVTIGGYSIEITNLQFRYPGATENSLENINAVIPPGKVTAIVGRNGAGKSTLANILLGLELPTGGDIRINGKSLVDPATPGVQPNWSVQRQKVVAFQESLAFNIDPWAETQTVLDETRMRLRSTSMGKMKQRETEEDERNHSDSYESFSGGQWQQIAFERAVSGFRRGRTNILLDEPTASLDPNAAEAVFTEMKRLTMDGATVVVITHDLVHSADADWVIMLENGVVTETGDPKQLIGQSSGRFANALSLYNMKLWEQE